MAEIVVENAVCVKCGVDVRENTTFCYNCGTPVAESEFDVETEFNGDGVVDDKTKSALDDLAGRLKLDEDEDKKLAKAAAERKKARVNQRKPKEFTWESSEDSSNGMLVVVALVIALLAGIMVFLTVF